jgi:hypothetical protein
MTMKLKLEYEPQPRKILTLKNSYSFQVFYFKDGSSHIWRMKEGQDPELACTDCWASDATGTFKRESIKSEYSLFYKNLSDLHPKLKKRIESADLNERNMRIKIQSSFKIRLDGIWAEPLSLIQKIKKVF